MPLNTSSTNFILQQFNPTNWVLALYGTKRQIQNAKLFSGDFPMENHAGNCYFHAKFLLWVNATGRLLPKTIIWMGVSKMSSQQELASPKSQHCVSQLFWVWCWAAFTPATSSQLRDLSTLKSPSLNSFLLQETMILALLLPLHWCISPIPPGAGGSTLCTLKGQHLWVWFQN